MPRLPAFLLLSACLLPSAPAHAAGDGRPTPAVPANPAEPAGTGAGRPQPPAAPAPSRTQVKALIRETAGRHGVELALVTAVVAAESAYDTHAVSHAGAIGLMQIMPETAADYGVTDPQRLFDPKVNLETGVRHLRRLLAKYRNDYGKVIMAYNAGEGVVDRTNSNVTYSETLAYTEAVIRHYRRNGGSRPTEEALRKVRMLRSMKDRGQGRQLLARYLDMDLPELKAHHTRSIRLVDPGLETEGPARRPMIVLEPREPDTATADN